MAADRRRDAVAHTLALSAAALMTACSSPGTPPRPSHPPPHTDNALVTMPASSHITYSVPHAAGGCLLGGTPPRVYPLWLCVPGAITSGVTQANLPRTACSPAYARRMRPPAAELEAARRRVAEEFGPRAAPGWRLDWLVPIALGGANDTENLWPASPETARLKADTERDVLRAVCRGTVRLTAAQHAMAAGWIVATTTLGIG
jgi:hypothetical protein